MPNTISIIALRKDRFHRQMYRMCAALGVESLAEMHAELAHCWREVA